MRFRIRKYGKGEVSLGFNIGYWSKTNGDKIPCINLSLIKWFIGIDFGSLL